MDPVQRKAELERRLRRALVLPAAIVFVLALVLGVQVERRVDYQQWVEHSEKVLAKLGDLHKEILDQDSGLRAFLLTNDEKFLGAYRRALPPAQIHELEALLTDNPSSQARVREIRERYDLWRNSRAAQILTNAEEAREPANVREGRLLMEAVRAAIFDLQTSELELREQRVQASQTSLLATRIAFVVLFLLAAAVLALVSRSQLAAVAGFYDDLMERERRAREESERERWVRAGEAQLAGRLLGEQTIEQLAEHTLRVLGEYVGSDVGALFLREGETWVRRGTVGVDTSSSAHSLALGEGPVGRAAGEKKLVHLKDLPVDYLRVRSGVGEHSAVELAVVPATADDEVLGVIELGFLRGVDSRALELMGRAGPIVGSAIRSATYRRRMRELLIESQQQAEELQAQQEELRVANEELEQQGEALRQARQGMEERQEHLERTNARLEEHSQELAQAREAYRLKASEADRASRYKSEFLANMSHELRTPLNSTLILAKLLADNAPGNLNEEQVRFAETIYSSGNDLLALINDILDLAKVEAGQMEVRNAPVDNAALLEALRRTFSPIAQEKNLELSISADDGAGELVTDGQRLEQILKNLLSNACKFTERGKVSLRISGDPTFVFLEVRDTGIGIAPGNLRSIFEPFRQADGTTERKYGGTGLGLSISRELAFILGGVLDVESELGKGSVFRLRLPRRPVASSDAPPASRPVPSSTPPPSNAQPIPPAFPDDRDTLDPKRGVVLVVEDDVAFARILYDLVHERKLQCLVAHDAASGLALAAKYPLVGVVLDVNLPDRTGLYVLDQLKRSSATRHVPVHMASVEDRSRQALAMGAIGYLRKPADRDALAAALARLEEHGAERQRRVLIVEDDAVERMAIERLLSAPGVETVTVATIAAAKQELSSHTFDCVVTDLGFPDGSGFDLVAQLAHEEKYAFPPIIVYTARSLDRDEEERLRQLSNAVILKGVRSPERLLDEVSLFLHQVENQLPPQKQQLLSKARDREAALEGKTVLIAEDDVRNIFALTKLLEPHGAQVTVARNGREALEMLERAASPDLVLMDVMMPEMDGLEAIRKIRTQDRWAKLPIIALTAKAMPDDRESCLQAGASDYISKPLNADVLLSLVRVWMSR